MSEWAALFENLFEKMYPLVIVAFVLVGIVFVLSLVVVIIVGIRILRTRRKR